MSRSAEASPEARLARLDSCAVSDSLDKLGLPGAVTGLGALTVQRKISGRVIAVRLAAAVAEGPAAPPAPHLGARAIERAQPGEIIVVEQRTGIVAGSWGGVLSNGAMMRQVAGVIAEGLVRDVDEARQLDFPVYARGSTPRTARGRVVEAETGGEITVGDVRVRSGDFVVADGTGVVFIGADQIEPVLEAAERIAAREAAMTKALMDGQPVTSVMGADYEEMLKR